MSGAKKMLYFGLGLGLVLHLTATALASRAGIHIQRRAKLACFRLTHINIPCSRKSLLLL